MKSINQKTLEKFFENNLRNNVDKAISERDTITGLVNEFISFLGYNRSDLDEYKQEYKASYFGSSDKVDIALLKKGKPIVFIECKKKGHRFQKRDIGQISKYFSAEKSHGNKNLVLGILTDGLKYKFFSEIEEKNILDPSPFVEFDFLDLDNISPPCFEIINCIRKDDFDIDNIKNIAFRQKYFNGIIESINSSHILLLVRLP